MYEYILHYLLFWVSNGGLAGLYTKAIESKVRSRCVRLLSPLCTYFLTLCMEQLQYTPSVVGCGLDKKRKHARRIRGGFKNATLFNYPRVFLRERDFISGIRRMIQPSTKAHLDTEGNQKSWYIELTSIGVVKTFVPKTETVGQH